MRIKQTLFNICIPALFLLFGNALYAQIQVFESEYSDSTRYTESNHQDSIHIVYKGGNNRSTITLYADYLNIDSLNFEWYKFNEQNLSFGLIQRTDTVKSDTLIFDDPGLIMDTVSGGYMVHIFNDDKNIDTSFTVWVWYQSFNISDIDINNSTCWQLSLEADFNFDDEFTYYDLSVEDKSAILVRNEVEFTWSIKPGKDSDNRTGSQPTFDAPVEPTEYTVVATDKFGYTREKNKSIDESSEENGSLVMIATKPGFSGTNGADTVEYIPDGEDVQINIEAPHGVWFNNTSKNGAEFEWIFYNHIDWMTSDVDTLLPMENVDYELIKNSFEPGDSIYYKRPKRRLDSPDGYEVKLTSKGPIYSDFGDRCIDTIRGEFVLVDTTQFPTTYEQLPNVFTPNGDNNNDWFYFVQSESNPEDPVKSIKYFSIKIYNRWGNKVYEYEDNDGSWHEKGKAQPGWDGKTRVGTTVKPGVYYYAIIAEGWNGKEFQKNLGGYVHVFY